MLCITTDSLQMANRRVSVLLACSDPAPLGRFLPKFLRSEVKSRLAKLGIDVKVRDLVCELIVVFAVCANSKQTQTNSNAALH